MAWECDDAIGHNIYVARWSLDHWESLTPSVGGVSATTESAEWPAVRIDDQGAIYIIWEQTSATTPRRAYLKVLR